MRKVARENRCHASTWACVASDQTFVITKPCEPAAAAPVKTLRSFNHCASVGKLLASQLGCRIHDSAVSPAPDASRTDVGATASVNAEPEASPLPTRGIGESAVAIAVCNAAVAE